MPTLKRQDVETAERLAFEDVAVPWGGGGTLRVWELDSLQVVQLQDTLKSVPKAERMAVMAAACVGDETGPFDPPLTMKGRSGFIVNQLAVVAVKLNRMSTASAEELRKNS